MSPPPDGATASEMIDHVPARLGVIRHVHALRLPSRQRNGRALGVAVDADAHGRARDPCCPFFRLHEFDAFGAFMQKLFRSDYSSTPDLAA